MKLPSDSPRNLFQAVQPELPDVKLENPERFSRVSFIRLQCVSLNQIIDNVILHLHKIYLNGTKVNKHENILNSLNKNLYITHFAINLHVVF